MIGGLSDRNIALERRHQGFLDQTFPIDPNIDRRGKKEKEKKNQKETKEEFEDAHKVTFLKYVPGTIRTPSLNDRVLHPIAKHWGANVLAWQESNVPTLFKFLGKATPARVERATHSLEGCCSIQLSYGVEIRRIYSILIEDALSTCTPRLIDWVLYPIGLTKGYELQGHNSIIFI